MKKPKNFNFKGNYSLYISLGLLTAVAFLYNVLSPYTTDDFTYMYSFATDERITSIFQVFPSMVTHYMELNGRTVAHFMVHCILILPKIFFNIVNSVIFTSFVYLIYSLTNSSSDTHFRPILFWSIPVCLWVNTPVFGQVFLWLTGSINYYWGYVAALIYMSFYLRLYRTDKELSRKSYIALCIIGFLFGGYSENISFPVIFVTFFLLVLTSWNQKNPKLLIKYSVPVALGAVGYITILLSPGNASKLGSYAPSALIHKSIDLLIEYYNRHYITILIVTILFVLALHFKVSKKELMIALTYVLISILSVVMLCTGTYLADRSLGIGAVFLTLAMYQLMQALRTNSRTECIAYCLAAYFIVSNVMTLWDGTYDIYDVYRQNNEREAYIEQQLAAGETVVTVPKIYPMTKYSCKYILIDLTTAEEEYIWPNPYIADYYGLDKIYGKEPWDY